MADYINKIRTTEGDKPVNYEALANKPNSLPNPNKIKFTGSVVAEYDGSSEVTVDIPNGASEEQAAQIQTNTNDISELKNKTSELKGDILYAKLRENNAIFVDLSHNYETGFARNITENAIIGNAYVENKYASGSFQTIDIDCTPYRYLLLVGTADTTRRLWCFLDASGTVITRAYTVSSENIYTAPLLLPVPDNAVRFIGNAKIDADAFIYGLYGESIKHSISALEEESVDFGGLVIQNKAINDVGQEYASTSGYCIIGHIILDGYSMYIYSGYAPTSAGGPVYGAYYDRTYTLISTFAMKEGTNKLDIPDNAMFIKLCCAYDAIGSFKLIKTTNLIEKLKSISDDVDKLKQPDSDSESNTLMKEYGFVNVVVPINYETGSFVNFNNGVTIEKNNNSPYNTTRQRTASAIVIGERIIKAADGYKINVFRVDKNNVIQESSGYTDYVYTTNGSIYWFVVKSDSDSDISNVDINSVVSILAPVGYENRSIFARNNTYWIPVQNGLEYTPQCTVDAAKFSYTADVRHILNAWRDLVADSNGYMTITEYGKDASGTYDIFGVSAKPKSYSAYRYMTQRPKIILVSGVHGLERESVYALYYLFYDIVHNWQNDKVLEYLRWNVTFEMIPCANPYGFQHNIYYNSNGVNINHNFDDADHSIGYGEDVDDTGTEMGEYAFSEPEAQYMKELFDKNPDATVYFDFHTKGNSLTVTDPTFCYHDFDPNYQDDKYNLEMINAARRHIDYLNIHYPIDYALDTDANKTYGYIIPSTLGGHAYSYTMSIGVYGHIIECPCNLPSKTEETDYYSSENLIAAVRSFGQWLQIAMETIYKIVEH